MTDFEFINRYRALKSVPELCKEEKINNSNLISKRSTPKNEKIIANRCKQEIINIFCEMAGDVIIHGD